MLCSRRMTALGRETATDADLVRKIAAGNGAGGAVADGLRKAEAELCHRFAPRIRLYGLRHLRDEDRARDLVQAVLLALLVAVREGRIAEPEHVDRFVLGTCRNTSLRIREQASRATPAPEEKLDVASFLPNTELIDASALVQCVAALDPRGRVVVTMSFFEERSPEQIATSLATSAGNVRVLRHRAIAALRQCLDGKGEGARPRATSERASS